MPSNLMKTVRKKKSLVLSFLRLSQVWTLSSGRWVWEEIEGNLKKRRVGNWDSRTSRFCRCWEKAALARSVLKFM